MEDHPLWVIFHFLHNYPNTISLNKLIFILMVKTSQLRVIINYRNHQFAISGVLIPKSLNK